MKSMNKKILLFALILAFITAYLSYSYLKKVENEASDVEYIDLIVASKDILPRVQITSDMLKEVKVIKQSYMVNSIQDKEKIIGMYSKEKILKGEVIPEERLVKEDEKELSLRIPDGKRAISISVDEMSGVADLIKVGDYVDVFVTVDELKIDEKNTATIYPQITKALLQNVQVLSVSKEMIRKEEQRDEIPTRYAVTLAVSVLDGEKLVLGEEMGILKLALRPLKENQTYITPGAVRQDIVPDKGKLIIPK